jgi:hypothetical protein
MKPANFGGTCAWQVFTIFCAARRTSCFEYPTHGGMPGVNGEVEMLQLPTVIQTSPPAG